MPNGGMSYPHPGSYIPIRGAYTPQMGAMPTIPGVPAWASAMLEHFAVRPALEKMGLPPNFVFGPTSPMEAYMGQTFQQQMRLAMGMQRVPGAAENVRRRYDEATIRKALETQYRTQYGPGEIPKSVAERQRDEAKQISEFLGGPLAMFEQLMPENWQRALQNIPGRAQQTIGQGVFLGLRGMAGAGPLAHWGHLSRRVSGELAETFTGPGSTMLASDVGGLVQGLGMRGLLPGRMEGLENVDTFRSTVRRIERRIKGYKDLIEPMKALFGRDKGIPQLLNDLDQATQGGVTQMGAGQLTSLMNRVRGLQLGAGIATEFLLGTMQYGAQAARHLGLVPSMGADLAIRATQVGLGHVEARGGQQYFGMRNATELQGMMNQRMLLGAASRVGIATGGVMNVIRERARMQGINVEGMSPSEMVRRMGGSRELRQLMRDVETGRDPAGVLRAFGPEGMAGTAGLLGTIGVGRQEAFTAMTKLTRGGQEMYSRYMSEQILDVQEQELFNKKIVPRLRGVIGRRMGGEFRGPRGQRMAAAALKALQGISDLTDVEAAHKAMATAMARAAGGGVTAGDKQLREAAADIYTTTYSVLEQEGGFYEILGGRRARAVARSRTIQVDAMMRASDLMKEALGTDTILRNMITDFMTPDIDPKTGKVRKRSFKETLGKWLGAPTKEQMEKFGTEFETIFKEGQIMAQAMVELKDPNISAARRRRVLKRGRQARQRIEEILSGMTPELRAKMERGEELTESEKAQVQKRKEELGEIEKALKETVDEKSREEKMTKVDAENADITARNVTVNVDVGKSKGEVGGDVAHSVTVIVRTEKEEKNTGENTGNGESVEHGTRQENGGGEAV